MSISPDKSGLVSTILIALQSIYSLDLNLEVRKDSIEKVLIDNIQNRVSTVKKKTALLKRTS